MLEIPPGGRVQFWVEEDESLKRTPLFIHETTGYGRSILDLRKRFLTEALEYLDRLSREQGRVVWAIQRMWLMSDEEIESLRSKDYRDVLGMKGGDS